MSYSTDVAEFHRKFNLPVSREGRKAELLSPELQEYRINFLREELQEFITACHACDLEAAADALVDLAWVAIGTAHYMGLPFDALWYEVKRANLDKVLGTKYSLDHKRGPVETIRKPVDWQPPQLEKIIELWNSKVP